MRVACLSALLLLAACEDRRSFDERFEDTSERIKAKERALAENSGGNELPAETP